MMRNYILLLCCCTTFGMINYEISSKRRYSFCLKKFEYCGRALLFALLLLMLANEESVFVLTIVLMELRFSVVFPHLFKAIKALTNQNDAELINALNFQQANLQLPNLYHLCCGRLSMVN